MTDFKKALQLGLDANADATAKREEIAATIKLLSQQVNEATGGVVSVELRGTTKEVVRRINSTLLIAIGMSDKEVTTVKYMALEAVRLIEPKARTELAEVEISSTGYPVNVTATEINEIAFDREALERSLETLLKHPDTGNKLQRLMNLTPKKGD